MSSTPSRTKIKTHIDNKSQTKDYLTKFRNKTIKTIHKKDDIVRDLITINPNVCNEFKKTIIQGQILGKGTYGSVYDVDISKNTKLQHLNPIPELGVMNYVMKTINSDDTESMMLPRKMTLKDAIKYAIGEFPELDPHILLRFNGNDLNKIVKDIFIVLNITEKDCLTHTNKEYTINDETNDIIIISPNNYICQNSSYTEYMIGVLCSVLGESDMNTNSLSSLPGLMCKNFVYITDFSTCISNDEFNQYIFMEKIDMDLSSLLKNQPDILTDGLNEILFQCFFAIYSYEMIYQLNHNDLHPGNVFIRVLPYTHYLKYEFRQHTYYIPTKYLVKIGDYGLSCKYSEPMILNKEIMDNEITDVIPNFYNTSYDILCLLFGIMKQYPNKTVADMLIEGGVGDITHIIQPDYPRPILNSLNTVCSQMNAERLLNNYFFEFMRIPDDISDSNIIFMGRMI